MTTPIFLTGWEHGAALTANGGGLANFLSSAAAQFIVTSPVNSGNYALRHYTTSTGTIYVQYTLSTPNIVVGRIYFRYAAWPSVDNEIAYAIVTAGANLAIKISATTHKLFGRIWGVATGAEFATACDLDTWYRLDFKFDVSTGTSKVDFQLNGSDGAQTTYAQTATTFTSANIGGSNAGTVDLYLDDLVLSVISGDYPIGAGGTELLSPSSDGTNNPGTNCMEWDNGTDIGGTVSAYVKLNQVPMGGTAGGYIRQNTGGGTANYVTVNLANISATHSAIIGSEGLLAYMAASATTDKGACFATIDNFATSTTIWGAPGSTADYSETSVFWKRAIIAGGTSDANVNALQIRIGHSDDTNPIPYWIDAGAEVAYATASVVDYPLNAESGAFSLTGNIVNFLYNRIFNAAAGALSLSGKAAALLKGRLLNGGPGSYALSGKAATFIRGWLGNYSAGSYALSGKAAQLARSRITNFSPGSYSLTGFAVQFVRGKLFNAAAGSYALTGKLVNFLLSRVLSSAQGSYSLTGFAAALTYTPLGGAKVLIAEAGSFTLTGRAMGMLNAHLLKANPATYALTGAQPRLSRGLLLNAAPRAFAITGNQAQELWAHLLNATKGNYQLIGLLAYLLRGRWMNAGAGSYAMGGKLSILLVGRMLRANPGSYMLTKFDAQLIYGFIPFPYSPSEPIIKPEREFIPTDLDGEIDAHRSPISAEGRGSIKPKRSSIESEHD